MKLALPLAVLVALVGCTPQLQALSATAIEQRRMGNDAQARLTLLGLCDLSYGSVQRLTPANRRAVETACGAEAALPTVLETPR